MSDTKQSAEDLAILEQRNLDYNQADQASDAKRFSEFLAKDFIVQTPGATRNREEFLEYIAKPRPFKDLALRDAKIRILGDVALIRAAPHTPCSPTARSRKLCTRTCTRSVRAPGFVSRLVRSLRAPDPLPPAS
jgi:hypothetical protein